MPAAALYSERRRRCLADERRLAAVSLRFSIARGVAFAAFLACLLAILLRASSPHPGLLPPAAGAAALAVFAALAIVHDRRLRELRRAAELRAVNEEGLARLDRDWERLPLPAEPPRDRALPLARDLDLYGRASVFHLLGTAHTPAAKGRLRDWLERGAPPAEIGARQAAVDELAPLLDFRQGLELAARGMERHPPDCEPFLRWAESDPWVLAHPALLWTARAAAVLTLAALLLACAPGGPWWPLLVLVTFNLGLSYACTGRLGPLLDRVAARRDEMMRYVAAMRHAASRSFASPRLAVLAAELAQQAGSG